MKSLQILKRKRTINALLLFKQFEGTVVSWKVSMKIVRSETEERELQLKKKNEVNT